MLKMTVERCVIKKVSAPQRTAEIPSPRDLAQRELTDSL